MDGPSLLQLLGDNRFVRLYDKNAAECLVNCSVTSVIGVNRRIEKDMVSQNFTLPKTVYDRHPGELVRLLLRLSVCPLPSFSATLSDVKIIDQTDGPHGLTDGRSILSDRNRSFICFGQSFIFQLYI